MRADISNISNHLIHIGNTVLERIGNDCNEQSTKFLCMHIDENLTWKKHISEVIKQSVQSTVKKSVLH